MYTSKILTALIILVSGANVSGQEDHSKNHLESIKSRLVKLIDKSSLSDDLSISSTEKDPVIVSELIKINERLTQIENQMREDKSSATLELVHSSASQHQSRATTNTPNAVQEVVSAGKTSIKPISIAKHQFPSPPLGRNQPFYSQIPRILPNNRNLCRSARLIHKCYDIILDTGQLVHGDLYVDCNNQLVLVQHLRSQRTNHFMVRYRTR